jgi:hypothetical protein
MRNTCIPYTTVALVVIAETAVPCFAFLMSIFIHRFLHDLRAAKSVNNDCKGCWSL